MPRDFEVYLEDILQAISKICSYTAGLTRKSFAQDIVQNKLPTPDHERRASREN
jgi:uncharacterized protein with HEPN domain